MPIRYTYTPPPPKTPQNPYDSSSSKVKKHTGTGVESKRHYGLPYLKSLLELHVPPSDKNSHLVCQYSSFASLGESWLEGKLF